METSRVGGRVLTTGPASTPARRALNLGLLAGYLCAWALVIWAEAAVWPQLCRHPEQILPYLVNAGTTGGIPDTTWMLPLLLAAPLAWLVRGPARAAAPCAPRPAGRARRCLGGLSVFLLGLATAAAVGRALGPLPPVYHDEYSYLFQARTFLAGRLWFPCHPHSEFFDQVHVLNLDGRFASRYFPGPGLWLAAFVKLGRPYWGYWLASGLIALATYAAGLELLPLAAAWLAGLLAAAAPALPVFGNLLLAHHPTLLGLGLFLATFLRGRRTGSAGAWALAGFGMGYAFLCRPLTAFGIGLPFAVHALARSWRRTQFWALAASFGLSAAALLPFNRALSGSIWQTPAAKYNDVYTPRNVYGFYNVQRGELRRGPRTLEAYDAEAKDLQPFGVSNPARQVSAVSNACDRILSMAQSTLGMVPLILIGLSVLAVLPWKCDAWRLLVAGLLGLHAVHLPYYYSGLFAWHYVFESAPILYLLAAGVTTDLALLWRHARRPLMLPLWLTMLGVGVATCWVDRGGPMLNQIAYGRRQFARFERLLSAARGARDALVFVVDDPQVHHIGFVVNGPDLRGPVVRAHDRGWLKDRELMQAFPGRRYFVYVQRTGQLISLPGP